MLWLSPSLLAWSFAAPGAPCNISVDSTTTTAVVRWLHAPVEEGGLATHYVLKWQVKDGIEIHWHPEWVGVGSEQVTLVGLTPGATYGVRVAAVNTQGRQWSAATAFITVKKINLCGPNLHWKAGLLDESEAMRMCGATDFDPTDPDSRGGECSVGYAEYILAGVAAGGTIALVLGSMMLRHPWVRRLAVPEWTSDSTSTTKPLHGGALGYHGGLAEAPRMEAAVATSGEEACSSVLNRWSARCATGSSGEDGSANGTAGDADGSTGAVFSGGCRSRYREDPETQTPLVDRRSRSDPAGGTADHCGRLAASMAVACSTPASGNSLDSLIVTQCGQRIAGGAGSATTLPVVQSSCVAPAAASSSSSNGQL